MIRAASGTSELRDGVRAVREAAGRAIEAAGVERARALFVFATPDHAPSYGEMLAALGDFAPGRATAGCSATGVLSERGEVERGPAVVVLAASGPGLEVETALLPEGPPSHLGIALGRIVGSARRPPPRKKDRESLILLFPELAGFDPGAFFAGLEEAAGFVPVIGAAPSGGGPAPDAAVEPGEGARSGTHGFGGGRAGSGRTATALVRGGAHVEVAVAQGCRPIGRPTVVTKVGEDGTVAGLASRPAAEALAQALEASGLDEEEMAGRGIFAGIAIDPRKHPLERGDFLVRPIIAVDAETGALTIGERAAVGQTIVFQMRDREAAAEDLEETLGGLVRRLRAPGGERKPLKPRFALYFDCLGRGRGLYGEQDHDITRIRAALPGMPIAGFFGKGEIAPVGGRNFLHAYTGVLAVFCEP